MHIGCALRHHSAEFELGWEHESCLAAEPQSNFQGLNMTKKHCKCTVQLVNLSDEIETWRCVDVKAGSSIFAVVYASVTIWSALLSRLLLQQLASETSVSLMLAKKLRVIFWAHPTW